MKVYIDFSILLSDGEAYGNVTGTIDAESFPKLGDAIELLHDEKSLQLGAPGKLLVQSITEVPGYEVSKSVVGLQDIVVRTKEMARELAAILESEYGLFCIEYD